MIKKRVISIFIIFIFILMLVLLSFFVSAPTGYVTFAPTGLVVGLFEDPNEQNEIKSGDRVGTLQKIYIVCESTVEEVRSVQVKINGINIVPEEYGGTPSPEAGSCEKTGETGWLEGLDANKIEYFCTLPNTAPTGIFLFECFVNQEISYTTGLPVEKEMGPCPPREYLDEDEIDDQCKQCGGVKFCSDGPIFYCDRGTEGVGDGVCPAKYGADCAHPAYSNDCDDFDCDGCGCVIDADCLICDCNNPGCWS